MDTLQRAMRRQWTIWKRPLAPLVKLKTDVTSVGNPGISGSRRILRDYNSKFIISYSKFLGSQTFVFAEAIAFLLGIRLAREMGTLLLWIEFDSL